MSTRYDEPGRVAQAANRVIRWLAELGISISGTQALRVRGRKTGKERGVVINLLTVDGRLSAVIDFERLGIGDPACDLMIAFTLMSARSRAAFRETLDIDDATWARGRGWALTGGIVAYASYAAVSPRIAAQTTRQITAALADRPERGR